MKRQDALVDRAEVVIVELVALGRAATEQRAGRRSAGPGALVVEVPVDQEVFLLGPQGGDDALAFATVAEEAAGCGRLLGDRLDRAQQGRLLVERLAVVQETKTLGMHERGAAGALQQEGGAGRVPGGVAARLEGVADAARGEGAGVGLALDQLLARRTRLIASPRPSGRRKASCFSAVLAGHGLEPVAVVRGAVLGGPLVHRLRDRVGDARLERLAVLDGPLEFRPDIRRQVPSIVSPEKTNEPKASVGEGSTAPLRNCSAACRQPQEITSSAEPDDRRPVTPPAARSLERVRGETRALDGAHSYDQVRGRCYLHLDMQLLSA